VQYSNSIETAFRGFQTFDPHHGVLPYDIPIDRQLEMVIDATRDQLEQGQVPRVIPSSVHAPEPPQSDLHRLAETGWFDHLKVNIDHRFEDGFLRPSNIVQALARQAGVGV
jgi:hypothetical protein